MIFKVLYLFSIWHTMSGKPEHARHNAVQTARLLIHSVCTCTQVAECKLDLHQLTSSTQVVASSRLLCQSHFTSLWLCCLASGQVQCRLQLSAHMNRARFFFPEVVPIYLLAILHAFKLLVGQELGIK